MVIGIGTDIVQISRFKTLIIQPSFLNKIYTTKELQHCESKNKGRLASLAVRYAAKEAVMKALGTGYAKGISFTEISVVHDDNGKPQIVLTGFTKEYAEKIGVQNIQLSLSHETDYAIAYVLMQSNILESN